MKYETWLDNPRNVKKLWRGFLLLLILTVLVPWGVDLHPHFSLEALPAFYAAFGFISCLLMILLAKLLALVLKRPDDYYTRKDGDE